MGNDHTHAVGPAADHATMVRFGEPLRQWYLLGDHPVLESLLRICDRPKRSKGLHALLAPDSFEIPPTRLADRMLVLLQHSLESSRSIRQAYDLVASVRK